MQKSGNKQNCTLQICRMTPEKLLLSGRAEVIYLPMDGAPLIKLSGDDYRARAAEVKSTYDHAQRDDE